MSLLVEQLNRKKGFRYNSCNLPWQTNSVLCKIAYAAEFRYPFKKQAVLSLKQQTPAKAQGVAGHLTMAIFKAGQRIGGRFLKIVTLNFVK